MESTWLATRSSPVSGHSLSMDTTTSTTNNTMDYGRNSYIPAWKMPISKSFSSALCSTEENNKSSSESGIGSGGERDHSTSSSSDPESTPVEALLKRKGGVGGYASSGGVGLAAEVVEEATPIQILLPCIICNRTFSPEALERHSKVCSQVNVKTPYKQDRGKFDSTEQRKKGTKVEYFIPPPDIPGDMSSSSPSCFSRGSKNRSSLRGTSCTTRSTLSTEALHNLHHHHHQHNQSQQHPSQNLGIGQSPNTNVGISPLRRQRSVSQTRGERGHSKPPSEYLFNDDHSEFGSNSEESHNMDNPGLPSYAKPLAPTDECPYCNRCFGLKAYDRHVEYCKEKYVKRQYEVQPVPKEKIEAMERQEIRTKYRPIKGSSSCTSLRSGSPGKDFASMAYKLFGLRRSDGASNLYNNQLSNFKKSNESITNSCYGDYTRGMRRPSPSPSRGRGGNPMSVTNKINNLLGKTFHYQQNNNSNNNHPNSVHPMKVNTSSNIPKLARSSDNLSLMMNSGGSPYGHISSSGYGQGQQYHHQQQQQPQQQQQYDANNSFNRNSRSRSSLHKNFFRSKEDFFRSKERRAEPEGASSMSMMMGNGTSGGGIGMEGNGMSSSSSSPLIITPMTFYTKKGNQHHQELFRPPPNKGTISGLNQDSSYDPYEMAAKQLEELLKSQPINKNVNKRTARKLGLEKAFESVGVHSGGDSFSMQSPPGRDEMMGLSGGGGGVENHNSERKSNEDQFVFDLASGKMDDSYWDEILRKSSNESSSAGNKDQQQQQQQRGGDVQQKPMSMSSFSETKSQQSDSSSLRDANKSRGALSQISSADSGFSRSALAEPDDFEALESMVGLGESRKSQQNLPHNENNNTTNSSSSSSLLSSTHPLLSNRTPFSRRAPPTQQTQSLYHTNKSEPEAESPMQLSPSPLTTPSSRRESSSSDVFSPGLTSPPGGSGGARFCHECGNSYPSPIAKFCSDCGEKRVFKF